MKWEKTLLTNVLLHVHGLITVFHVSESHVIMAARFFENFQWFYLSNNNNNNNNNNLIIIIYFVSLTD